MIIWPLLKHREKLASISYTYPERLLITVSAALLSWELSTYNYNYYLDNAFYLDRVLLISFPFFLWRIPFLSPIYLAIALVYRSQFNYPLEGFELFDKRLLFDILILSTALSYIKIYFKEKSPDFLQLVLCMVASNYFVTGVSKIVMSPHGYEWLMDNQLSDFFLNAHQRGWMYNVSDETIQGIYSFIDNGNFLLKFLTLIIELSAFCILINRRWALIGLSLFIVLHFGIFIAGSMLFWKWIAIDALLIFILLNQSNEIKFYSKSAFKTSLFVILTSIVWLRPYPIGWFDTKVNQFFNYEAEDENGQTVTLHKNDFNPYHQWIQYDKFLKLVNQKALPISGFGYTHDFKMQYQVETIHPDSLINFISENGKNNYDEEWKIKYDDFMKRFFYNRNQRGEQLKILEYIRSPHHLYNSAQGEGISSIKHIKKLRVYFNITYNLNGKSHSLNKTQVDEIII